MISEITAFFGGWFNILIIIFILIMLGIGIMLLLKTKKISKDTENNEKYIDSIFGDFEKAKDEFNREKTAFYEYMKGEAKNRSETNEIINNLTKTVEIQGEGMHRNWKNIYDLMLGDKQGIIDAMKDFIEERFEFIEVPGSIRKKKAKKVPIPSEKSE